MLEKEIADEPSWTFGNDKVEAAVTRTGGHLGPVSFKIGRRKVQPFALAPWTAEKPPVKMPEMLRVLRGDFFCLPFGGNERPWQGERHPPHGETANRVWTGAALEESGETVTFRARLRLRARPGTVDKQIELRRTQTAVYCRHRLSGISGPMNFGHHAMLAFNRLSGPGLVSTSAIRHGQVYPGQFEDPALGGYSCLKPGATFKRLDKVPLATGGTADLGAYPAREGFEDLVLVATRPEGRFAWTAVVYPKADYVWFALKDPRILPATVLWHSHGGRHYPPWNGRHRGVLGLEEVIGHFHDGLAESVAENALNRAGIPTVHDLDPKNPLEVRLIMAMAPVPPGFGPVRSIAPGHGGVILTDDEGEEAHCPLDPEFLHRN
ncbi:MAG: hypothetical protein EA425_07690 [Puniceicoccaceae bacterium]|nr:MAG: hypothetical protein EA425_07690 [Puniceicoccaceae bacterium]